ncbi:DMT family transporter [Lentzea flaviverrucosa]|uniref:Transporter family-2 protein n=1 Tax=Lentzea flaviverrucosa TaxID=200379 RepID=A0A1H9A676_9PSEU|nr:DMT family transporter [Lentzea flaviverrucosa]RDI32155.1 transporter family-2 protein [Lentzea flaviverrucosa]SEP72125.1 transporter family-2 protein [Lentzea flaviverrucosa]
MYLVLLSSALLVGCLLAVQASANLQLTKAAGTPYGASALQLGLAAVLLTVLAAATGTIGAVALVPDVEPWHLAGGLASPLYITSGILLFPRLGALAAVGLFVTGQMFASVALDLFGLLGVPQNPLSAGVVAGAVAVLAGITVLSRPVRAARAGWIGLGLAAGAVLPVQGAINARLRADLHAPLAVALISFTVATLAIVVVLLFHRTPAPEPVTLKKMPWWGWLGAGCAAAYVTATFLLIPEIGAATTVALTVTGQQIASAVIDHCGLLRMPRRPLTSARVTGLTLLVTGSLLVQFG